jgi:hypothetical protein
LIIVDEGKLGMRKVRVPEPGHVEVLRALDFQYMTWPNGKRYELRSWPGIKRVRG